MSVPLIEECIHLAMYTQRHLNAGSLFTHAELVITYPVYKHGDSGYLTFQQRYHSLIESIRQHIDTSATKMGSSIVTTAIVISYESKGKVFFI